MSFSPVVPSVLLILIAAVIVVARVVALHRIRPKDRTRSAIGRWCGLSVAAALLLIAAARPVLGEDLAASPAVGAREPNVFLVLDRSADMALPGSDGRARMAAARDDAEQLIARHPAARFAVIGFADRPSLDWPLSADTWSLRPVLAAAMPYPGTPETVDQTNVGAADNVLRYQLISAVQQYPRALNLVYYLGAGAPESEAPQRAFELPEGSVDGGAVLGYSADGGAALQAVADQIGLPYRSRVDNTPLAEALPQRDTQAVEAAPPSLLAGRTETYWLPAAGAAVLLLIELFLVLREFRRTRLSHLDVMP